MCPRKSTRVIPDASLCFSRVLDAQQAWQHTHHDVVCLQLLAAEGLPLEEAEARVQQLAADVHAVLGAPRVLGQAACLSTWHNAFRRMFTSCCACKRLGAEC